MCSFDTFKSQACFLISYSRSFCGIHLTEWIKLSTRFRVSWAISVKRTPIPGLNVYWSALGQTQATPPFADSHSSGLSGSVNSMVSLVPTANGAKLSIKSPPPPIPPARLSNWVPSGVVYLTRMESEMRGSERASRGCWGFR